MTAKLLRGILAAAIASAAAVGSAVSVSAYELERHSQTEIKEMYQRMYFDDFDAPIYTKDYSVSSPAEAGSLSPDTLEEGLNSVNFCRYLAGLPYDVELSDDYNVLAQNASLIIYMNGELNHDPAKPAAMSDQVYSLAHKGSAESNIGKGYMNIQASVVEGYMSDTDANNIAALGHRRWILNPDMQKTGFGMVFDSTAMYVRDKTRDDSFTGDYICWPPANMPYEMIGSGKYGYAYSVTLNPSIYDKPERDKVKVTLTSKLTGNTWTFDKNSSDKATDLVGYFNVATNNCGINNCIIFNPGVLPENDVIDVKVTGIYKNGVESPISYKVNYFNMLDETDYTAGFPEKSYNAEPGHSLLIRGYNNPISSGGYSIWNICPNEGENLSDYFTVTQSGANLILIPKKEGSVELLIGTTETWDTTKTTMVNISHVHTRSGWYNDPPATATTPGRRYRKCTECQMVIDDEVLPAKSVEVADVKLYNADYSDQFRFTGSPVEPKVNIHSSGKRLVEGVDYEVTYSDNTSVGTGHLTITGKGSFNGEKTVDFPITKRDPVSIEKLKITYKSDGIMYTGSAIEPKATLKEGSYTLVKGTDYTVTYENNLSAGTGRMTITGIGDYFGETSYNFKIEPADIGYPWVKDDLGQVKYSGMPIMLKLDLISQISGEELEENVDYVVSYENNTNIGTATITVTGIGNYSGSTTNTFEIVSSDDYKGPDERDDIIEVQCNVMVTIKGADGAEVTFVNKGTGEQFKGSSMSGGKYYAELPNGDYVVWAVQPNCQPASTEVSVGGEVSSGEISMLKYGDVNADGKINASDTVTTAAFIKGLRRPATPAHRDRADVNQDGKVTSADIGKIAAHVKGIKVIKVIPDFVIPSVASDESADDSNIDENGKSLNSLPADIPQPDVFEDVKAGYLEEYQTEWGELSAGLAGVSEIDIDGDGKNELLITGSTLYGTPSRLYADIDGSAVLLKETESESSILINPADSEVYVERTEDGTVYTEVYTYENGTPVLKEMLAFSETAEDDADFGEYTRIDLDRRTQLTNSVLLFD